MLDTDMQSINDKIYSKSEMYINFKSSIFYPTNTFPAYLSMSHKFSIRRIFTLLRTHSLPLKSNLLRWKVVNNNLCEKCTGGVYVENEFHLLFRCNAYTAIRSSFIPDRFTSRPNITTLYELIESNDINVIKQICEFIFIALNDRLFR